MQRTTKSSSSWLDEYMVEMRRDVEGRSGMMSFNIIGADSPQAGVAQYSGLASR